jgi:4-aminobutyrate aminotransferase
MALLEDGLVENAAARGAQAMAGLESLAALYPGAIREVRGKGLMIGIEFDTRARADAVQTAAFQRGLLVLECGRSTIRMSPALTVSADQVQTALRLFGEAVAEVADPDAAR